MAEKLTPAEEQRYNELHNKFNATGVLNSRENAELDTLEEKRRRSGAAPHHWKSTDFLSVAADALARDVDLRG